MVGTIYIVHENKYIKSNQNVYKIGKTGRNVKKRVHEYPRETVLRISVTFENHDLAETDLIAIFNSKFKLYEGREHFEGDIYEMMQEVLNYRCVEFLMIKYSIKNKYLTKFQKTKILEEKLSSMLAINNSSIVLWNNESERHCVIEDLNNNSLWFVCSHSINNINIKKNVKYFYELKEKRRQIYMINLGQIEKLKELSVLKTDYYRITEVQAYLDGESPWSSW